MIPVLAVVVLSRLMRQRHRNKVGMLTKVATELSQGGSRQMGSVAEAELEVRTQTMRSSMSLET